MVLPKLYCIRFIITIKIFEFKYLCVFFQYHPDKNKDAKAQEKFVNVVEAYNVLGKPSSRARYDNMIAIETNNSYVYRTHVPYK